MANVVVQNAPAVQFDLVVLEAPISGGSAFRMILAVAPGGSSASPSGATDGQLFPGYKT